LQVSDLSPNSFSAGEALTSEVVAMLFVIVMMGVGVRCWVGVGFWFLAGGFIPVAGGKWEWCWYGDG
jgi:hypothetical protein